MGINKLFNFKNVIFLIGVIGVLLAGSWGYKNLKFFLDRETVLKQIIHRLEADSRIAEVLVTNVKYDELQKKTFTTIKFLEYGTNSQPLEPKYFTFSGNIIQFQSLVIRFKDIHIKEAHKLKDKSAYVFWKVFMLDGKNTQEFEINPAFQIPSGYKITGRSDGYEGELWTKFWEYALDPKKADTMGIKNAQIEAPGTMFIPGNLYVVKIEHNGGIRIDVSPLPGILRGEAIK
ncbi:MAG: hypothetical protein HQL25_01105 [Candidatus Omnitrophica bacterium]|nr:hypothetical protein [Candidatus Omnitrophota bacterium]